MHPLVSITGERDAQGHYILSPDGLASIRKCINAYVAGEQWPGVSVRQCTPYDLDSRFSLKEECGAGERVFELVIEVANPPTIITVLCSVVDRSGTEAINVSLPNFLAHVSEIEHQLGDVYDVASERCRGLGIERQSRQTLRNAEVRANRACDLLRAITANPVNWHPITASAQMFAVAEFIGVTA